MGYNEIKNDQRRRKDGDKDDWSGWGRTDGEWNC